MSFEEMMTDTIKVIKYNGEEFGPYKASVQINKIFLMQSKPLIESGDIILREMSNGGIEKYRVINPGFQESFDSMDAHYQMTTEKLDRVNQHEALKNTNQQITNIFYGSNSRVNNNSVDSSNNTVIVNSVVNQFISSLREEIDKVIANENEQKEAHEIVNEIQQQFESGSPKKSVIRSLISAIPQLGNIASIGSFLIDCCK